MHTPEIIRCESLRERASVKVIHMFGDPDARWDECIDKQEVKIREQIEAFFGDICIRIRRKTCPCPFAFDEQPAGICRGVPDKEQGYCAPEEFKWLVGSDRMFLKREKPEKPCAIADYRGCSIDRGNVLDPVKLPESDKMVVMPMRPDNSIDSGSVVCEELLPKVRRGIDKDMLPVVFNKEGGS